jgi:quercetin dioxygenase-like cupin family protein
METLYKNKSSGLDVAEVYPTTSKDPFFVDLVRLAPGASTRDHAQKEGRCYMLTAVTLVSGFSLLRKEDGTSVINEHVYLKPGETLIRPRDFKHQFVNNLGTEAVFTKTPPPRDDCPRKPDDKCKCYPDN